MIVNRSHVYTLSRGLSLANEDSRTSADNCPVDDCWHWMQCGDSACLECTFIPEQSSEISTQNLGVPMELYKAIMVVIYSKVYTFVSKGLSLANSFLKKKLRSKVVKVWPNYGYIAT